MKADQDGNVPKWECYTPPDDEDPERGYQRTLREIREWFASKSRLSFGLMAAAMLVILGELMLLSPEMMDGFYHLLAGWFMFAWRTFPQIQFNGVSLLNGMVGLSVACLVLHWVLVKLTQNMSATPGRWQWKWTLSFAAVVAAMFGICVVTVGLVTSVGWTTVPDRLSNFGTPRQQNGFHAETLAGFAKVEAEKVAGQFPRDLYAGVAQGRFPFDESFAYFYHEDLTQPPEYFSWLGGGLSTKAPGDIPFVAAPRPYGDGTRLVAFLDESVKECTEEEWQAALVRWRQAKEEADRVNKPEGK